jgi:hypothetical protein
MPRQQRGSMLSRHHLQEGRACAGANEARSLMDEDAVRVNYMNVESKAVPDPCHQSRSVVKQLAGARDR